MANKGQLKMLKLASLEPKVVLSPTSLLGTRLARLITDLTAPPFVAIPCFVVLGVQDHERHHTLGKLGASLAIALSFGVALPVLVVVALHLTKRVSDIHIYHRQQRTVPFVLTISCLAAGTVLLWLVSGPCLLSALLACYAFNTLVVMLINFRWKISVHATGIGGPLAAFTLFMGWAIAPLFGLVVLVAWARVYLRAHTAGQVVAGSALGYFFTLVQLSVLFRIAGWVLL